MEGTVFDYNWVITHSTIFHADDVFGVALCRLLNPQIQIIRTLEPDVHLKRVENIGQKAIVFDIGLGTYDHHQVDKVLRKDGTPYCGFGLLWRDFGRLLCEDEKAWDKVDQVLVLPIDKHDNGVSRNLLSGCIGVFNPDWNEDISEDVAFHRAMQIAQQILKAQIDHANSISLAKSEIISQYTGGEMLVLDRYLPWMDTVQDDARLKDVLFTVFPSPRGGWNVQTVTIGPGTFQNRANFPEEWLGHADPSRGIHFAHTSNFLIACGTKEQAIQVAQEAVEANNAVARLAFTC